MSLAAQITATGITAPSYADIVAELTQQFYSIYGSDAYLDPDSQDGQWIAVFAQAISDANDMAIAVYNSFSPTYAQGTGLSSVVKINGLQRNVASFSTAPVVIVGQANTTITNGLVGDDQNLSTKWALPPSVTIPNSGTVTVTATCTVAGATTAAEGTLTQILTPTQGWQTVSNSTAAASPGNAVELDPTLRQRQSVSTALTAQSPLDATVAAVANVPGVQRYAAYENSGNTTDANGVPSHSISIVVQGGDVNVIAQTIASKKTPGTGTYGTTSIVVQDSLGISSTINFFELATATISVMVDLTPLAGYVSTTGTDIQEAIAGFISALPIGMDQYLNKLLAPANLNGDAATAATGMTQAQLNALAATFNIKAIYQGRSNMIATGGPYNAGATSISVMDTSNLALGQQIAIELDDGSYLKTVITVGPSGGSITFATAVPSGFTINAGGAVLVAGNIGIAFNEAAYCLVSNVDLISA